MGHGIAQVAALSGYRVALFDVDPTAVEKAFTQVRASLEKMIVKGRIDAGTRNVALSRLVAAPRELEQAAPAADLVVEAVPEKLDLKKSIFATLGSKTVESAILATNTSSLPVKEIAAASGRPSRVVGMHFFNPVPIMDLLEVVRTDETAPDVLASVQEVGKKMGKTVITVKDFPGFA